MTVILIIHYKNNMYLFCILVLYAKQNRRKKAGKRVGIKCQLWQQCDNPRIYFHYINKIHKLFIIVYYFK